MFSASMSIFDSPRLLVDLGNTHARFALERGPGLLQHAASLRRAEHADFDAAVRAYLAGLPKGAAAGMVHAAVAGATPVRADSLGSGDGPWPIETEPMRQRLGLDTLVVVSELAALAMALPRLGPAQRRQVGGGVAREQGVLGLLAVGPDLGMTGLVPSAGEHLPLGSEGGQAGFAPRDERELDILRFGLGEFPHLGFERLLSEPGLELMHRALARRAGRTTRALTAAEITRRALAGSDALCVETLDAFCGILGTAAAQLALTLGATGGIYLGGSILPRLGVFFDHSPFRARFEDAGGSGLADIPTYVLTAQQAMFTGASALLAAELRTRASGQGPAILGQIRRLREGLSPAERRVADHVLAHPRSALGDPVAEIARAAQVSQPTVIRFCRRLGCEGLSDFKLRLASGLSAAGPVVHAQVTNADSPLEMGAKVLGNTASAILSARSRLNRDTLASAIEVLATAGHIEFFALGPDAVVADDARFKFLRLGLPSASHTEPRLQDLAARVLRPGGVALLVSSAGDADELLAIAETARGRGARVLAITASQSPLARAADLSLIVDHQEDGASQLPMVSRILQLLVVDMLAAGVALRLGQPGATALPQEAQMDVREDDPQHQAAARAPLARLIPHCR